MPVVVNSNATATASSFNLSRANDALRKSLERLSTGKRINSAADDAGGLSVAYKLNSKMTRTSSYHSKFAKCAKLLTGARFQSYLQRVK